MSVLFHRELEKSITARQRELTRPVLTAKKPFALPNGTICGNLKKFEPMSAFSKLEVIFCVFLAENNFVNAIILFIRVCHVVREEGNGSIRYQR